MKKRYLHLPLAMCLFAMPLYADNADESLEESTPASVTQMVSTPVEAEAITEAPLATTETLPSTTEEKHVGKAAEDGSLQGAKNDWGKYVVAATVVGAAITAIILVSHK